MSNWVSWVTRDPMDVKGEKSLKVSSKRLFSFDICLIFANNGLNATVERLVIKSTRSIMLRVNIFFSKHEGGSPFSECVFRNVEESKRKFHHLLGGKEQTHMKGKSTHWKQKWQLLRKCKNTVHPLTYFGSDQPRWTYKLDSCTK